MFFNVGRVYSDVKNKTGDTSFSQDFGVLIYGMTKEEVLSNLGKPKQVINEGQKDTWYYQDIYDSLKEEVLQAVYVIFVNNRVVEVKVGHPDFSPSDQP